MAKPQMYRRVSRNQMIFLRLKHSDPREIYGMLLTLAKMHDYKDGWVAHKFREIFGKWPKPTSEVELIPPDSDLLCWVAAERRKYGVRQARKERQALQFETESP